MRYAKRQNHGKNSSNKRMRIGDCSVAKFMRSQNWCDNNHRQKWIKTFTVTQAFSVNKTQPNNRSKKTCTTVWSDFMNKHSVWKKENKSNHRRYIDGKRSWDTVISSKSAPHKACTKSSDQFMPHSLQWTIKINASKICMHKHKRSWTEYSKNRIFWTTCWSVCGTI